MPFNLKNHLMSGKKNHGWSVASAASAVSRFQLRKTITNEPKRKRLKKLCPVKDCHMMVTRIDQHLRSKRHKNDIKSPEEFKDFCKKAQISQTNLTEVTESPSKLFRQQKSYTEQIRKSLKKDAATQVTPRKSEHQQLTDIQSRIPCSSTTTPKKQHNQQLPEIDSQTPCCSKYLIEPEFDDDENNIDMEVTGSRIPESSSLTDSSVDRDDDNNIETLLKSFYDHLTGPDINRDEKSCKQVVGDFRRIYNAVKPTSILQFLSTNLLKEEYLSKYCKEKNYTAETIRKYLRAVIDFCSFLITENPIKEIDSEIALKMKLRTTNWIKQQKKDSKIQAWEKMNEDLHILVDSEQFKKYEEGDNATIAKNCLKRLEDGQKITLNKTEFCAVRDHLLVKIHFGNGNRSGVSANMKIEEFHNAKKLGEFYVINVREHKTYASSGPATITLTDEEYKWMRCYIDQVRSITLPKVNNVFVSYNGVAMQSGAISGQLNSQWIKAGNFEGEVKGKRKLSANVVRKSTVTGIRDKDLGNLQEVADNMAHSLKTAETNYLLRNKQKSAAVAGKTIREFYNSSAPNKSPK